MSEVVRITPSQLERLFQILRYDERNKKWKHKSKASEELGISRPTIDKILKLYPQGMPKKPKKTLPAYFDRWEQSDCAKKIKEIYWDRKVNQLTAQGVRVNSTLREAWKIKVFQDPLTFTLEDFLFFWGTPTQDPHPNFIDTVTNKIQYNKAVALRFAMTINPDHDIKALINDPRFTTEGLKREKGAKAYWYLEPSEVVQVVNHINEVDTLLLMYCGILMGGRISALLGLRTQDIHRQLGIIDLYEPKIKTKVKKRFYEPEMSFLWQYVIDFQRTQRLFQQSTDTYNIRFSKASLEAGLPPSKRMTTHMLKHTCVTLMRLHGVELGTVSQYIDTEPQTLLDYYVGGTDQQIDEQIGGIRERPVKTWRELIKELTPYFIARYNYLKPYFKSVDGIKRLSPTAG